MRKAQGERYPAMAEVVAALDAYLAGGAAPGEGRDWFPRVVGAPAPPAASPEPPPDANAALAFARDIAAWDGDLYRVSTDVTRLYPELERMIERLDALLAERPDRAWARFVRGMARARLGRTDEALEDMERSIDRVGDLPGAHFELGRLYLRLGIAEQDRAHRHLSVTGHEMHIDATRDRLEQAVVAFHEASRRAGGEQPVWQIACARAVERLAERDFDGCVAVCDEILAADPDLEEVWKLRGDALRLAGEDPVESYERALEVRRSAHTTLFAMAEAELAAGRLADARRTLERTLRVHPGYVPALVLSARIHLREADLADGDGEAALGRALAALADARKRAPDSYDLAVTHAEVQLRSGRDPARAEWVDRALEALARARELDGCQNRVEHLTARALLQRARHTRAAGGDPSADLAEVRRLASGGPVEVPDNHPWLAVLRAAEELDGERTGDDADA